MTELETLDRAKMYMEKLAKGINPIDDSVIPDEDTVNNVRLSRCFFYVADVLRQIIDQGGVVPTKKQKKEAFFLSLENAKNFAFSDEPITVTEMVKRINDLTADENMIQLTTSVVLDWLVSVNALQIEPTTEGHFAKRPTTHGAMLGIGMETRNGMNGPYSVVVYNRDAQQFLLDNLEAAVELYRQKTQNQGLPWRVEDDQCLRELFQKGITVQEMASELKRNNSSIRARLRKLGITQ